MDEETKALILEMALDLECEVKQDYCDEDLVYPSMRRAYDREMEVVYRARAHVLKYDTKEPQLGGKTYSFEMNGVDVLMIGAGIAAMIIWLAS